METKMKDNFNYYASKIMECEKLADIVKQLYWCYCKYNGWKEAENYNEILDCLNTENKEALADKVTSDWNLNEESATNILYDITVSELNDKYREA